jgi:hypothetical protein
MLSMTGVRKIVDVHCEEAGALAAFGRLPKQNLVASLHLPSIP